MTSIFHPTLTLAHFVALVLKLGFSHQQSKNLSTVEWRVHWAKPPNKTLASHTKAPLLQVPRVVAGDQTPPAPLTWD